MIIFIADYIGVPIVNPEEPEKAVESRDAYTWTSCMQEAMSGFQVTIVQSTSDEAKGIISGVHTPTFDIDEDALTIGCGLMAWLAVSELYG